ncbi:MAG: tripartite tricarboxylate transporter substrate binding protein [Betaproteobacteria bacterium]|nr:tripartite tricarboxylate transporter substrate binding protein [Betaproteobacteria bacterium]MDH5342531.1 tripartite tricarboxylate transporter substrate binding protein [Betaproteobacteria bacterium]
MSILIFSAAATAQTFPTRPVRILIPFTVGSAADVIARAMEPAMREKLGQALVIDNRGGAGGNIAAELTVKSPPDGYTLLMGTIGTQAINYSLYSKLSYHPLNSFTPVARVGDSPNILVVNPSVPAKSVKELIALAKARPGVLNYSSSGAGTSVHLSGELFNSMAGVKTVHVPFKGASEALTALISGQTDLQFASASSAIPMIKANRLRALGVTSPKRIASFPELPTIAESGLPGFDAVAWFGIVGPANLPAPVVSTLSKAALEALAHTDVKNRLAASGVEANPGTPEEFRRLIEAEIPKWAKVVKASGAKVD